jgi:hypothetical protein
MAEEIVEAVKVEWNEWNIVRSRMEQNDDEGSALRDIDIDAFIIFPWLITTRGRHPRRSPL